MAKRPKTDEKTNAPVPEARPTDLPIGPIGEPKPEEAGGPEPGKSNQIKLTSKIKKRNTFMSDKYRDERDTEVLNAEAGKREHKGRIRTITRIKQMEVDKDGFWVTEFIIDLKE